MGHVNNVSAPRYSTDTHQSKKNTSNSWKKLMFQMSKAHAHHHMTGEVLPSQLQSRILNVLRHQLTFEPDPVLRGG